ncbi:SDR family oxidoreductase [Aureimonas leprariae]|uniref:SDR family oxidoreductase n=1 Tax=Plantimonas leprariae TaxID=2615207 RepID=UPI001FE3DCB2|nr:SDR family oxidoreductase [Aureimonas leprariae]
MERRAFADGGVQPVRRHAQRLGETSDIAAAVAFLASDEGRWVTAQVIEASGSYKL